MTIDDKLLNRLHTLSALSIDESKRDSLKAELSNTVSFIDNLSTLDISNIDATFTTLEGGTLMADDEIVQNSDVVDFIINHAPSHEEHCFVVPKIIE